MDINSLRTIINFKRYYRTPYTFTTELAKDITAFVKELNTKITSFTNASSPLQVNRVTVCTLEHYNGLEVKEPDVLYIIPEN